MSEKEKLKTLFYEDPRTPEGKYLVLRRDDTVPEWPWFVLGAADPITPWALRAYAVVSLLLYWNWSWSGSVWRTASMFARWRRAHRTGDPDRGRHRIDSPAVIARMRQGRAC